MEGKKRMQELHLLPRSCPPLLALLLISQELPECCHHYQEQMKGKKDDREKKYLNPFNGDSFISIQRHRLSSLAERTQD